MLTPAYILQQVQAIFAMAGNDDSWRDRLDTSTEGVFRSFWAIPLSLPLAVMSNHLLIPILRDSEGAPDSPLLTASPLFVAGLETVTFLAGWGACLVLLGMLCRSINAGPRISPLLVSYNWSGLIMQSVTFVIVVLVSLSPEPALLMGLLLGATALGLYLRWGTIRRALETDILPTLAIMAMLMLVFLIITSLVSGVGVSLWEQFFAENAGREEIYTIIEDR